MRLALVLLLAGVVLLSWPEPVRPASCNATALWQLLSQEDVLVQLGYRFASDGLVSGVTEALAYYEGRCANGSNVPFFPIAACDYLNGDICARALAGSVNDTLRVGDALLRYRNPFVSGQFGCPDILMQPVVDPATGLGSCVCPPHARCIVSSTGAVSLTVAAVDEPTAFFLADFWLLLVVMLLIIVLAVTMLSLTLVRVDRAAAMRMRETEELL